MVVAFLVITLGVVTKLIGQVETIFGKDPEELDAKLRDQLQRIDAMLSEKLTLLNELDEQILAVCMVEEIEKEIDETETFTMRIMDTRADISTRTKKKGRKRGTVLLQTATAVATNEDGTKMTRDAEFKHFRGAEYRKQSCELVKVHLSKPGRNLCVKFSCHMFPFTKQSGYQQVSTTRDPGVSRRFQRWK